MTARAELYQKLLKQAAKDLRCKVTDERCKNYAVLKLAREVISSKLVSGRDIDPGALRWLSEELEKYAPAEAKSEAAPKPPANVVPLKRSVRDGALLKR